MQVTYLSSIQMLIISCKCSQRSFVNLYSRFTGIVANHSGPGRASPCTPAKYFGTSPGFVRKLKKFCGNLTFDV